MIKKKIEKEKNKAYIDKLRISTQVNWRITRQSNVWLIFLMDGQLAIYEMTLNIRGKLMVCNIAKDIMYNCCMEFQLLIGRYAWPLITGMAGIQEKKRRGCKWLDG